MHLLSRGIKDASQETRAIKQLHEPVQIKRKGEIMAAFTKIFTKHENKVG